jgi:hypothetical protein
MFTEPTPGAVYGCHDRNLQGAGFQIVIDVSGPTGEILSVPEYKRSGLRPGPSPWPDDDAADVLVLGGLRSAVDPLEREQRLAGLQHPVR